MTKPTYTPQRDSLASQVCGYLQLHPVMALTLEDITDKFDAVRGNVHTLLARSVESGLLRRSQNDDGEYVYQPGPALPKSGIDLDKVHTTRKPRKPAAPTDPNALEIRDDPLPTNRSPQINKYFATFDALPTGKCVRCRSDDVGKVSAGLRKYMGFKRITGLVRSAKRFEGDEGYGRVWLLAAPAKALKAVA
jgi:hypothetical protein